MHASHHPHPIVAVTMGDAAGVGPEITVAAALDERVVRVCSPLVIGDRGRLHVAAEVLGVRPEIVSVERPCEAITHPGRINVVDLDLVPQDLEWGRLSPQAGEAAYQFVRLASELALAGEVSAICTGPLNKAALHSAGRDFPGHTELLAALTGTREVSMMLATEELRVIHVTTHVGLADAVEQIEPGLVLRTIERGHGALRQAGFERPRIGVCAVNPHAGENGLFGRGEEEHRIAPAIEEARRLGMDVTGPLPADTAFAIAARGGYDLIVAMYHDQGHIAIKMLGIDSGTNITVGLPVVRTSVDHGTAFDIAGKGIASAESMVRALIQAAEMASPKQVA